jgi:2-methylcitrate dehydratase PrpD
MAIGVLERQAGIAQFTDKKVRDPKVVELMKRVTLYVDDELEGLGYDQVRSRVRITLKDGRTIEGRADVARGHPLKPMSWDELGEKFTDCARLVLPKEKAAKAMDLVSGLERLRDVSILVRTLAGRAAGAKRPVRKASRANQ